MCVTTVVLHFEPNCTGDFPAELSEGNLAARTRVNGAIWVLIGLKTRVTFLLKKGDDRILERMKPRRQLIVVKRPEKRSAAVEMANYFKLNGARSSAVAGLSCQLPMASFSVSGMHITSAAVGKNRLKLYDVNSLKRESSMGLSCRVEDDDNGS
ncbi:hypothetical protein AK812_SmicGene15100 [Symbiodinium microadriaticum]|uniref:Uncharacterized protein n=1 Tax=Symbiodinium microadriaticum TaxID=2951 RepID=A0A1Q9E3U5_SYMMI|nr:hypothetical protein AK812_SmicGene15100 [Symbiodinium microadriaticum]